MSRQPQMVQGEASIKRQILAIVILTGLVFGVWWSFMGIYDMFYGGSRGGYQASENLDENSGGKFGLYRIPMATFPNIDFGALAEFLTPEQLQELLDLMGGNLDNLDPSLLADLLGADPEALATVMFRVYDYLPGEDFPSWLFRYSVYDSFAGDDWSKTEPAKLPGVYQNNRVPPDVTPEYRLRIPLGTITPNEEYSVTVPCVSPDTSIQQNTVTAQNPSLDWNSVQMPYVDEYGMKYLKPIFTTSSSQNISLHTWGFKRAGGSLYYNVTTRSTPSIISASIRSRYLTFPGGASASVYAASRPNFAAVVAAVQTRMNTNPSANLFVKANMIRNYIQESFACDPYTASQAADIVEDACAKRVGDYYAIASTYIMLARYFEIPARFVMGYSGNYAGETSDPTGNPSYSGPANTVEMKLLNMYTWAETFMPVQDDGTGDWVSMDVVQESFEDGVSDGNPVGEPLPEDTVMRMFVNGTELGGATFTSIDRPIIGSVTVNITVNVTVAGIAYSGPVTLYDLLEEQMLGVITATNGRGEFLWNINTTVLAGGHGIRGTAGSLMNFTGVGVRGPLNLEFVDRFPAIIDKTSAYQDLRVLGYLEDTTYTGTRPNNRIPKANITVTLDSNPNQFTPGTVLTNETGEFARNITLNPSVVQGLYTLRLTFPGMFTFTIPGAGLVSAFVDGMYTESPTTKSLNVIDPNQVDFSLYLNGTPNSVYDTIYNPGHTINATVQIRVAGSAVVGRYVNFAIMDNRGSGSPSSMGSSTTNGEGWANVTWSGLNALYTGPAVVRAQFDKGGGDIRYAYAFCFINRSINLYLSSISPDANIIIPGDRSLGFTAHMNDTNKNPVLGAQVMAIIYDKAVNPSYYFTVSPNAQLTDSSGNAVWSAQVLGSDGALGFYDLRCNFYGGYNFNSHPWWAQSGLNPGFRTVWQAATNNSNMREIVITDSSGITMCDLWVNDIRIAPSYSETNIQVFNTGATIKFTARCRTSGFIPGQAVRFYDETQGSPLLLGTNTTDVNGFAYLYCTVQADNITGPHEITMTYDPGTGFTRSNYTVVYIRDPTISFSGIYVNQPKIVRGITTVQVFGALKDSGSGGGQGVYKAKVNLKLFDINNVEKVGYINGMTTAITDKQGNFSFSISLSSSLLQGAYRFRVDNDDRVTSAYSFTHCPTYLTAIGGVAAYSYSDVTVNATVSISEMFYTPETTWAGGTITVNGTFRWDNYTALQTDYAGSIWVIVTDAGNPNTVLYTVPMGSIDGNGYVQTSVPVNWGGAFVVTWALRPPSNAYVSWTSVEATGVGG